MSDSVTPQKRPHFLIIPFLVCAAVIVAGIAFLLTRGSDDPNSPLVGEPPKITDGEAARIRAIVEEGEFALPFATTNRGRVVEISGKRIVVESDGQQATWPLAADTQIWKNREAIGTHDVKPGDTVEFDLQQVGSRSDGWMNAAVKISVFSDKLPDTTNSSQLVMPTTEITGVVVEARARLIVIKDAEGRQSTYPLQQTALVLDGSETIALSELAAGERVKLTTSKSGSRSDGWIVTANQIERQP